MDAPRRPVVGFWAIRDPEDAQHLPALTSSCRREQTTRRAPTHVDPAAPRSAVDAACRGALVALRPALDTLCVDLISDLPWPDEATRALITLEPKRRKRWLFKRAEPHITADLMVTDDAEFEAALTVVPYTICTTGITHDGIDAYNADDSAAVNGSSSPTTDSQSPAPT